MSKPYPAGISTEYDAWHDIPERTVVLELGKVDLNGHGRKINRVNVNLCMREEKDGPVFSVQGDIWNGNGTDTVQAGQCDSAIENLANTLLDPAGKELAEAVLPVWRKLHLQHPSDSLACAFEMLWNIARAKWVRHESEHLKKDQLAEVVEVLRSVEIPENSPDWWDRV